MSNHAVVERAAREQASISETEAAIRLLRYSAKKGGLPPALTERLLSALWELEEIVVGIGATMDAAVDDWPETFAFDHAADGLEIAEFAALLPAWITIVEQVG